MSDSVAFIDAGDAARAENPDSAGRAANIASGAGGSVCVRSARVYKNE